MRCLPCSSKCWTHVTHIKMENIIHKLTKANIQCTHQKGFKHNYLQKAHRHTVQTDSGEEQWCLTEIFVEEKLAFEGRESSTRQMSFGGWGGGCSRCGHGSVRKCENHGVCGWSVGVWGLSMWLSDTEEERREQKGLQRCSNSVSGGGTNIQTHFGHEMSSSHHSWRKKEKNVRNCIWGLSWVVFFLFVCSLILNFLGCRMTY